MSTRLALPAHRNHITQKVKIAGHARSISACMTMHTQLKFLSA